MIAVDTNILVHAHREDSPQHRAAFRSLTLLAEQGDPWGLPWPCVHEFLAVVTHARVFRPPTALSRAIAAIDGLLGTSGAVLFAEGAGYWRELKTQLHGSRVTGPRVHDARIVALCREHGFTELWTADRDFTRFRGLRIRNPLA